MCLLVVLSRVVPEWPLIVAANRDEQYARPADPATVLRDRPRTLGGRDRLAGGTWLAVNEHGVVAALTNQPMQRFPERRSRGEIPLMLTGAASAAEAVREFTRAVQPAEFNPCWIFVADRSSLFYIDLTGPGPVKPVELEPGAHVLENRALGEPSAKVERVHALLKDAESLRPILADHEITAAPEGDDEWAQLISRASACCVHTDLYGTRASTLVRVPPDAGAQPQMWASDGPSCTNPLAPVPDLSP